MQPPSEKVHQIIARTALFVSKNGGQSEIILRVKQGDNPTFGFLMPDHHLHPYFRFLVDNQDLLHSKDNRQPENEGKISNSGALSLLGSVYGTGEEDDGGTEHPSSSSKECVSGNTVNVDATISAAKTMLPSDKAEPILKTISLRNALKAGSIKKDEFSGSISSVPDNSRASSLPPVPKTELMLVDPPSDMKRLVEKIVEFIIKNGRQFETVLMEQDRGHGRFPFLIPSNIFHPYYLKVLQKAQESKAVKSFYHEKEDIRGHISNKKKSISRENGNNLMESDDIPLDSERKEKFKMVINKSKKEGSDLPAKSTQSSPGIQVDADQAAAILQAATRGIKPSNLGILYGQPSNDVGSSESNLTHEQKLKAERLKRAKMFMAQLKSGAALSKADPSRGSSVEPQAHNHTVVKTTEKSTYPSDHDTSDNKLKSEKQHLSEEKRAMRKYRARSIRGEKDDDDDDGDERERKRSHRHHRKKHQSRDHSGEDVRKEKYLDERDYKHAKRRHRSHGSSHKDDDMGKIAEEKDKKHSKKKHQSSSSFEDEEPESEHEYSRKKHRSRHSSHDEIDSDDKYSRKKRKHRSHKSSHRHKHRRSHSSGHKETFGVSSAEDSKDHKVDRNVKGPTLAREELEDGEISGPSKGGPLVGGATREPSVDVSSSYQDPRPLTQPSETTEVPDDLRAKIRAMLMSTM